MNTKDFKSLYNEKNVSLSCDVISLDILKSVTYDVFSSMSNRWLYSEYYKENVYDFEFARYLLNHVGDSILGRFPYTSDWTGKNQNDMKWTKRVTLFGKKTFPDTDQNIFNNIASRTIKLHENVSYTLELSDKIDWRPGTFSDDESGSCYWGCYADAKNILMESGKFLAVKLYDDQTPAARCWLVFEKNGFVIFNCYSDTIELNHIAIMLSNLTGLKYRRIDLDANAESVYINGDSGFYFSNNPTETHYIKMKFDSCQSCELCGESAYTLSNIEMSNNSGRYTRVCDDCLDNLYSCDNCGLYSDQNDMIFTDQNAYCESCADEYICHECHNNEKQDIYILKIQNNKVYYYAEDDFCSIECYLNYHNSDTLKKQVCLNCGIEFILNDTNFNLCGDCIDQLIDEFNCISCGDSVYPYMSKAGELIVNKCKLCGFESEYSLPQPGQIVLFDLESTFYYNDNLDRDYNYSARSTDDRIICVFVGSENS